MNIGGNSEIAAAKMMEEDPLVPLNRGPYASRRESAEAIILYENESEGNTVVPNPNVGAQPKKNRTFPSD